MTAQGLPVSELAGNWLGDAHVLIATAIQIISMSQEITSCVLILIVWSHNTGTFYWMHSEKMSLTRVASLVHA